MSELRNLTDADVEALAEALEEKFAVRLERAAGKGILDLAKRGFWIIVLGLAVYSWGAGKIPISTVIAATGKG